MKVQKAVLKETEHIAIGVLIADVIMCIVFALLKKFDYTVVLGALLGTGIAVANFFFLGVTLQKAVGMQEFASKYVRQSYSLRMFFCFAGVIVSVGRSVLPSRRGDHPASHAAARHLRDARARALQAGQTHGEPRRSGQYRF